MGIVSSVSIQKGGPGKTTVCRNLGEEVSETGRKVLLIDNDPQGNLTKSILGDDLPDEILKTSASITSDSLKISPGISNSFWIYEKDEIPVPHKITENLYLIGATKELAEMSTRSVAAVHEFIDTIFVLSSEFDDTFIDCPPSAGTLQTAAHGASNYLIIPTHLSEDSIDGVKEQIDSANANKRHLRTNLEVLGILINGKDSHKILIEEAHQETLFNLYGELLFNSIITRSIKVSEARSFNSTVRQHAPNSIQAEQFVNLTEEYLERSRRQINE